MEDKVEFLKNFAEEIGCIFVEKGKVGFGRPCVGILEPNIEHYVDINPVDYDAYYADDNTLPIEDFCIFGYHKGLEPTVSDAYHKHSCMAVLVHNDDYEEAISQLYTWVCEILKVGEVELKKFNEQDLTNMNEIDLMFAVPYKVALVYSE